MYGYSDETANHIIFECRALGLYSCIFWFVDLITKNWTIRIIACLNISTSSFYLNHSYYIPNQTVVWQLVDGISHMRPILRMESQSGEPTVEEAVRSTIQDLKQKIVSQDEHLKHTQEDAHQKLRYCNPSNLAQCNNLQYFICY